MSTPAFWIHPDGYIVPVNVNHINTVIRHPAKFGFSRGKIEAIYRKHNEPIGSEKQAREEIIIALVKKGWIRLRRYPNLYWSITLGELNDVTKTYLRHWARRISGKGLGPDKEDDMAMPLRIHSVNTGEICDAYNLHDCIKGKLKASQRISTRLKFRHTPNDLPDTMFSF